MPQRVYERLGADNRNDTESSFQDRLPLIVDVDVGEVPNRTPDHAQGR